MGAQGSTTVNFGSFPGASDASVTVTGQSGIGSGSLVEAWVWPVATADHTADEHCIETIRVCAGDVIAGTGFTIRAYNTSQLNEAPLGWLDSGQNRAGEAGKGTRLYGQFTVAWVWN
jgi:hypothetical protein